MVIGPGLHQLSAMGRLQTELGSPPRLSSMEKTGSLASMQIRSAEGYATIAEAMTAAVLSCSSYPNCQERWINPKHLRPRKARLISCRCLPFRQPHRSACFRPITVTQVADRRSRAASNNKVTSLVDEFSKLVTDLYR